MLQLLEDVVPTLYRALLMDPTGRLPSLDPILNFRPPAICSLHPAWHSLIAEIGYIGKETTAYSPSGN